MNGRIKASDITAAIKLRERDLRARMLADSAVAVAMQELASEAPDEPYNKAREYAHRVAQLAATILVSGIYLGDEEIRALREERDEYKKRALDLAMLTPPRLVLDALTNP